MFWFYIHVCLQNITGLYINLVFLYVCVLLMSLHMHAFAIMSPFFACKNTVVFCCCGCLTPTATNEIPSCYWGRLWLKLDCMIYIYMYIYTLNYLHWLAVCVCVCVFVVIAHPCHVLPQWSCTLLAILLQDGGRGGSCSSLSVAMAWWHLAMVVATQVMRGEIADSVALIAWRLGHWHLFFSDSWRDGD